MRTIRMKGSPGAVMAALLGCAMVAQSGCASRAPVERWEAYSTSAMAITGDVRFSSRRIVFQDGAALPLQFVRQAGIDTESGKRLADIYRVRSPRPLRLRQRNIFCDPQAAYIAVIRDGGRPGSATAGDYNDRNLYVYTDDPLKPPPALCAIYNYENKPDR